MRILIRKQSHKLREGGQIGAGSLIEADSIDSEADRGNGGTLNINAAESVEIFGIGSINDEPVNSSLFTLAESTGNAGNLTLTTNNLSVSDGGSIDTSASASGAAGNLTITATSLDRDRGTLIAATAAGRGNIQLKIDNNITLTNNSLISAAATGTASGGNIDIDTTFIIALPEGNSDLIASAEQEGTGGRITIDAESIFGLQVGPQSNSSNDIDASGGVDGDVIINTPNVELNTGLVETSQNVVTPEQITARACRSDRSYAAKNTLIVKGKGGVSPPPDLPLSSQTIIVNGESAAIAPDSEPVQPILTSYGAIIPARGAIKTEDAQVILTGYSTNSSGDNVSKTWIDCKV